jgi:hypothetical protein
MHLMDEEREAYCRLRPETAVSLLKEDHGLCPFKKDPK